MTDDQHGHAIRRKRADGVQEHAAGGAVGITDLDAARSGGRRAGRAAACDAGNARLACHAIPGLQGARMLRAWAGLEATADAVPAAGPVPGVPGAYVCGSTGCSSPAA